MTKKGGIPVERWIGQKGLSLKFLNLQMMLMLITMIILITMMMMNSIGCVWYLKRLEILTSNFSNESFNWYRPRYSVSILFFSVTNKEWKKNRPPGRLMDKWKSNTGTDFKVICCESVNLIQLAPDKIQWSAVVKTIINLPGAKKAGQFIFI
jgi:hypothetical protein